MQEMRPSLDVRVRLVSRYALFMVVLFGLFAVVAGPGRADSSVEAFQDNVQVIAGPGYHAFAVTDGLGWIFIGGLLWVLSILIEPFAPLRSRLAALCGVAQLVGALGGFTRLFAVPDLATRYIAATTPDQQRIILGTFQTVANNFDAMFTTGQFFQSVGFLLLGSALLALPRFPRWLALWTTLPGVTAGILFLVDITVPVTSPLFEGIFFPTLLVHILVGTLGLNLLLAGRLWRFKEGTLFPA